MVEYLIDLSNEKASDINISGGKGASLSLMWKKGINVPPALILTTTFTKKLFESAGIREAESHSIDEILRKIDSIDIPSILGNEWETLKFKILEWKNLVVRSSILYEDNLRHSLAGQGESVIGVTGEDDLIVSIKKVLKSFFNPYVINHFKMHGEDLPSGASIIQKFIPGEFSGVLFTRMNGKMIIEYVPGIASPLVQGKVEPGRYEVNPDGRVINQKIPDEFEATFFKNKFIKTIVRKKPLPQNIISLLVETGKKIEDIFKSPRDIEWTFCCNQLFILQARPITHREDFDQYHWSRILGEEFWSGRVSPAMFSLVGSAIEESMIKKPLTALFGEKLGEIPGIALFYNHIYINLDLLKLAFQIIPRWALTGELLSMFPESMKNEIRENSSSFPLKLPIAMIRFLMARLPWYFHKNHLIFQRFVEEKTIRWLDFSIPVEKSELLETLFKIERELKDFLSIVVWGVTYAYIGVPLTLKIFEKMTDKEFTKNNSHILFSGLKGDINTIYMKELKKIKEKLPEEWKKVNSSEELKIAKEKHPEFTREWEKFIKKYRHRSEERDLFAPRWEEDELIVLKIVQSSSIPDIEERKTVEIIRILRKKAKEEGIKWKTFYFPPFFIFLWLSRTYLTMRENMRFYADIYLLAFRKILLKIAEKLVEEKILQTKDDIFFITLEEIEEILHGKNLEHLKKIKERKENFYREEIPPDYILGGKPFEVPSGDQEYLTGETISPGYARGKVRIINSLEDFLNVKEGEIIVMSNIDPSWSTLIGKVSGAIFEVGGLLSHGAIIAREFKIPAVAGVKEATRKLKNGDEVFLDATSGYITRITNQK